MKKLTLNKETVANLSLKQMNEVKGLTGQTCQGDSCAISACGCPTIDDLSCDVCINTLAFSNCPECIGH